tara:strand:- start:5939 stop:6871 length:933 start_codon:yes stop_codon:yes gene_type:complete
MENNIIYTCFSCPAEKRPKFLDLHIDLIKDYAKKCKCDYKVMDVTKNYNPPVFTVYEAYKEFAESNYNKMLYIDWDVLISLKSDNIFDNYNKDKFTAYKWKTGFTDKHIFINTIPEFNKYVSTPGLDGKDNLLLPEFIKKVCGRDVSLNFLRYYVNNAISGGVMMFDKETMNTFLFNGHITWEEIYDRITLLRKIPDSRHDKLLNAGGVLSHFAINYLLYINDIKVTALDKKWNTNSVTGKMKPDEFFYNFNCGGDELITGNDFSEKNNAALKYVINNKSSFFNKKEKFTNFIKKYNATDIIKSKGDNGK